MTYPDAWRSIEARIHSIAKAAELNQAFGTNTDNWGRIVYVYTQCVRTFDAIRKFQADYSGNLPKAAEDVLAEFIIGQAPVFGITDPSHRIHIAWHAAVVLPALASELSHLLADEQVTIRSRAEIAFAHLQRLIAVDEDYRKIWRKVFDAGETRCEKQGSLHLLWHQILAFKVNAGGARTDLVFPEPIAPELANRAAGLVLTEWKIARSANEVAQRFDEAKEQAELYSDGPLSGVELRGYRFLVVVSERQAAAIPDVEIGGVLYRHINIAIEPETPSVSSKKTVAAKKAANTTAPVKK